MLVSSRCANKKSAECYSAYFLFILSCWLRHRSLKFIYTQQQHTKSTRAHKYLVNAFLLFEMRKQLEALILKFSVKISKAIFHALIQNGRQNLLLLQSVEAKSSFLLKLINFFSLLT